MTFLSSPYRDESVTPILGMLEIPRCRSDFQSENGSNTAMFRAIGTS